jgi:2-polyprenyl-3-methyl-5-hydroxy-6-metoxy-1,4-benzoquinol methylase
MRSTYRTLFERDFTSVLELGTGGGEITIEFAKAGLDYVAVEGTKAGCLRLLEQGIPRERIVYADLRTMPNLNRRFDLAMCTEVIEHVEPFFASKIVGNCVNHADVVWFSAADRNRAPHYHHVNEQDIEAWDNIFAFLGHSISVELDGRFERADRVYIKDERETDIR